MKTALVLALFSMPLSLSSAFAADQPVQCTMPTYNCTIQYWIQNTPVLLIGSGPSLDAAKDNQLVNCLDLGRFSFATCRSYVAQTAAQGGCGLVK